MAGSTVALYPVFKWVWDTYGESIVTKTASTVWNRIRWEDAALKYTENIKELYGITRVLGQSRPMNLEDMFTNVYVLDKPEAYRRHSIEELEMAIKQGKRPHDVEKPKGERKFSDREIVNQENKLFILGKPGAGKTTFLKHTALQAANGKILSKNNLPKIPMFIPLNEYGNSGKSIIEFLVYQFVICGFPENCQPYIEQILRSGHAIVLFDGLDEVNNRGDLRSKTITEITDFTNKYHNSQHLITCRVAATDYSFEHFTDVEMADFTMPQIRTYVSKWFRDKDERNLFLEEFEKPENVSLQEIAKVPLLLGMLCLAFNESLAFSNRRVEIYEEAIDALLKKWDSSRKIKRDEVYRKLSLGWKRKMLSQVAYQNFENGDYFLQENEIENQIVDYLQNVPPVDQGEDIDGEAILNAMEAQHGIIIPRAFEVHSFSHLTFQEYFTARYIVENEAKGTLTNLSDHLTDDRWREVFFMTASMLADADLFFEIMLTTLNKSVLMQANLVRFFQWANGKAISEQKEDYILPSVRLFYLARDRARARARARDLALALSRAPARDPALDIYRDLDLDLSRDRARARARARARDRDLARDLARALDRDRALDPARALDRYLDLALDSDRALARALDHALALGHALALDLYLYSALDLALARARARNPARALDSALDSACTLCVKLGLIELEEVLTELIVPKENSLELWIDYSIRLQKIIQEHRNIGWDWDFTEEEVNILADYFAGTTLIYECLELAYVSNREKVENRLLLPQ